MTKKHLSTAHSNPITTNQTSLTAGAHGPLQKQAIHFGQPAFVQSTYLIGLTIMQESEQKNATLSIS